MGWRGKNGTLRHLFGLSTRLLFSTYIVTLDVLIVFAFLSCLLFGPMEGLLRSEGREITSRRRSTGGSQGRTTICGRRCRRGLGRVSGRTRTVLDRTQGGTVGARGRVITRTGRRTTEVVAHTGGRVRLRQGHTLSSVGRRVVTVTSTVTNGMMTTSVSADMRSRLVRRALGRVKRRA